MSKLRLRFQPRSGDRVQPRAQARGRFRFATKPRRGERFQKLFRPGAEIVPKETPGSRPGLHSVAAPRLAVATYFGHHSLFEEGNHFKPTS